MSFSIFVFLLHFVKFKPKIQTGLKNMQWTKQELAKLDVINNFYFRGKNSTRLETFIDAAFAFAITMLVISVGDIPKTYTELITALKKSPAFLASFAAVALFWIGHRRWSRRYGLEDSKSIILSFSLIFVTLVYVYPLRLLFSALFSWISNGWLPSEFIIESHSEMFGLFIVYGIGLAAMSAILAFLFLHAKSRPELLLTESETILTSSEVVIWFTLAGSGLLSALIAWTMPPQIAAFAGFVYMLLPIMMPIIGKRFNKKVLKLKSAQK
jgi:uncharacterized membrane protein